MNSQIREAYYKGLRVIDSCHNAEQFEGSRKFVENFYLAFINDRTYKHRSKITADYGEALLDRYLSRLRLLHGEN
jgi:hypothetical protein|tara:strand:- start:187 stop:411 length:225 start_codon:yes stop_codon:yes gene_type:complete